MDSMIKRALLVAVVVITIALVTSYFALQSMPRTANKTSTSTTISLVECKKPPGGYLIIADRNGFNGSAQYGPTGTWPIIRVKEGSTVSIVICNLDIQTHGFNMQHYFDSNIFSLAPGQTYKLTFVATAPGNFTFYCTTFCSVHRLMQHGLLEVQS